MYNKIVQKHNDMLIFIKKQNNYVQFCIKTKKEKLKNKIIALKSCEK